MICSLRQRADFLSLAQARKIHTSALILQGQKRGADGHVRIGFTVTRKNGHATERNRIRRRLRHAVRHLHPRFSAAQGWDFVIVARKTALHMSFQQLTQHLDDALSQLVSSSRPARASSSRGPS